MGFFGSNRKKKTSEQTGTYVAPQNVSSPANNNRNVDTTVEIEHGIVNNMASSTSDDVLEQPSSPRRQTSSARAAAASSPGSNDPETGGLFSMFPSGNNRQEDPPVGFMEGNTSGTLGEDPSMLTPTATLPTAKSQDSNDSKDTAFTITRNGQYLTLNGFANGHLMRWKFAAEEGPAILRIPAILLACAIIFTTLYPIIAIANFWTIPVLIIAFHVCIASFLIIILEGRVLGIRNPTNARARLRGIVTRYLNVLKLLWGRGLLFIFAASLNLAIDHEYCIFSAVPMLLIGILSFYSGCHASYNLDQLKTSLTDESYLWVKFSQNDADEDGMIDLNGFAELLWSLGLEFDDIYTYKAFQQIDQNGDAKISFDEFKHWWVVTQNDGQQLVQSSPTR